MTTTFVTANIVVTGGNAVTLAGPGDTVWIASGVLVASTLSAGVTGSQSGQRAYIDGTVYGGLNGIFLSGNNTRVTIGATGSVIGDNTSGFVALQLNGTGAHLVNGGSISGAGVAVLVDTGAVVENTGTIHGGQIGVRLGFQGGAGDTLINLGHIGAGSSAGFNDAVVIESFGSRVTNHGTITATGGTGAGIGLGGNLLGGDATVIENTGTISSVWNWGIDMSLPNLVGSTVINSGRIGGGAGGILGGALADIVQNRGTIQGSLLLGGGGDRFDGRGGVVAGVVFGEAGDDVLIGGGTDDVLSGDAGQDEISGGADDDGLYGGEGSDTQRGGGGDDLIFGEGGDDLLAGGAGADLVYGGTGTDTSTGGAGNDLFVWTSQLELSIGGGRDLVTDFAAGDLIDLRLVADGMVFIGSGAFTGTAKEVRYAKATGLIQIDTDGDGTGNFQIELTNHAALNAAGVLL